MFFSKLPSQLIVSIGEFSVQVTRKDIRTVRLSIRKATSEIRLSVPKKFSDNAIQEFLKERISWIAAHIPKEGKNQTEEQLDLSKLPEYRKEFEVLLGELVPRCEAIVGKKGNKWKIRRMKSRWGTCNVRTGDICLNLELIRYSKKHIEYVIIHELVHLYEPSHNARFYSFMDQFCPDWKITRAELNGKYT